MSPFSAVRVMLVDDHDVVRAGLKTFLETNPDILVVGEAANGSEALERIGEARPDVVVMDITMPEMDGLEATRRIKAQYPYCEVLALTVHDDQQYFFEMLAAGASGYLTKSAASDDLVDAILALAQGHVYLQPSLARFLLQEYRKGQHSPGTSRRILSAPSLDVLSEREKQVLTLVAEGLTTPEIAERLELSPKTVSRHRERIMNKLNLHSAAALVRYAIRVGLVHP
ncbi:MAG: DNA-binding response regulator [Anaerolineae bacterium]|nr:MAG: DNA-binding response regulator [Anaerolineae bacterium]